MRLRHNAAGFTLVELLIYIGVFSVAAGLFTGILSMLTRVQVRENATVEVSQQAQFVIQTIQRVVTDASIIELSADTATSTLKLRMADAAKDPTCIQLSGGVVYLMEGNDGLNKQTCFATSSPQAKALTDGKVVVNTLNFTKLANPPAKDTVKIDLTLAYNSQNPQESAISRTLQTAITKISAATFDSDVIPATDNIYNVGLGAQKWANGFFSNLLVGYTSVTGGVAAFNGSVAVGTSTPAASALVDLTSTAKGFLPPRMTTAQRDGITSPAAGLLIYNATSNEYNLYNGTSWGAVGVGWAASSTDIYNTNSGKVGIGTTSPVNKLDVSGAVAIGTYAGVNTGPSNGLIVSGNVGIGTASPTVTAGVTPGSQTFTSSGTFTVPEGVTSLTVTLAGGGGGGGSGGGGGGGVTAGGGGGGGGGAQYLQNQTVSVTPGQQISVTVGAGGTGGTPGAFDNGYLPGNPGTNGGSSTFLTLTASGGLGGQPGVNTSAGGAGGAAGGSGGTNGATGANGQTGGASCTNQGGTGGTGGASNGTGGTGGVGGRNCSTVWPTDGNPGNNYGAGGGGGGGGSDIGGTSGGKTGGNGAPGYALVSWGDGTAPGATTFLDIKGTAPGIVLHASNTGDTAKQFGLANTASGVFIDSVGAATATNNAIIFRVSGADGALTYTERMRIQSNGNVGIGTSGPTSRLFVEGSGTMPLVEFKETGANNVLYLRKTAETDTSGFSFIQGLDSNSAEFSINGLGTLVNLGADYAEYFLPIDSATVYEPGDLVELALTQPARVQKSARTYSAHLLGAVSERPSVLGNMADQEDGVVVGLLGRVKVRVSAESGPIGIGDYITSSTLPGIGMKATRAGRVIGVALEPHSGPGVSKILVLVNPTWIPTETLIRDEPR